MTGKQPDSHEEVIETPRSRQLGPATTRPGRHVGTVRKREHCASSPCCPLFSLFSFLRIKGFHFHCSIEGKEGLSEPTPSSVCSSGSVWKQLETPCVLRRPPRLAVPPDPLSSPCRVPRRPLQKRRAFCSSPRAQRAGGRAASPSEMGGGVRGEMSRRGGSANSLPGVLTSPHTTEAGSGPQCTERGWGQQ